ncbi:membrane protein insertase YidC [Aquamicrobium zhengzhouense]|uniref:Membrane protein insertase YidC n=1 Tax=Aquamicrobium zhengzhouense TaxID=2781738 RepID=A0ABS0SHC9_9HYPH|nr:membrane protein insertase YidC [Aquamicrobium zhengzhouense]MBI1622686.1 membrane protein insertase YidC [Aquamicrobium zhengzhouense]
MENNRNFFITIALSVAILVLWQVFYMNPRIEAQREVARVEQEQTQTQAPQLDGAPTPGAANDVPGQTPAVVPGAGAPQAAATREAAIAASSRVEIDTPRIAGSINLTGGRIDDLILKDYRVTVEPGSDNIELLNPSARPDGYFAEVGFVGNAETGEVPGPSTVWTLEGEQKLTPSTPVKLTFTNDRGLTFTRTIAVDGNYMFTISDSVANAGEAAVSLSGYGRIARIGTPATEGFFILHEGLIGVTGTEGLQEIDYSDLAEKRQIQPGKSEDGWLGITDKYWAVAMVPSGAQPFQPRYAYFDDGGIRYQADYLTDPIVVSPGQAHTLETMVFAGAKETAKIDAYEEERGIRQFDLLIDWGWFYFITKPMFYVIDFLFHALGNFGLAILATTVIVKAIFFPLANKSYKSMANMKKVQPQLLEIRERYADDRMKQQQAMMELYKTEKINPLAGCWPVLIQIPVFFALYKVLYVTIEMRHAPFFGWIKDLSAPDPTSLFNLFGLLPYDVPAFLLIGVWPILMGITMFLQMRMNPTPPDPTQAMIFNWMPVVFTFMLASFPAGLVIYWAWNNLLSITQQGIIMKRQGARIELWDNLIGLFKKKPKPAE